MNRRERRLRASQSRGDPAAGNTAETSRPVALARAAELPADPIRIQVGSELANAKTEANAIAAASLAGDAMRERLDGVWARSGRTPACKRGCSYCCTVRVSVSIPEVLQLVAYARETLPPNELALLTERAKANAAKTHGATALGYPPRLDCAFLGPDRSCLVHHARPLMCRREHAIDAAQCREGYERAAPGMDHPIDRLIPAKLASDVVLDAYRHGLADVDVDSSAYELQEAAHIAFSDSGAVERWLAGKATFASARLNASIDMQLRLLARRGGCQSTSSPPPRVARPSGVPKGAAPTRGISRL
ncbi:MAG: YkgJ family cysteine cluster protein [Polyangiaceae bacterium]